VCHADDNGGLYESTDGWVSWIENDAEPRSVPVMPGVSEKCDC